MKDKPINILLIEDSEADAELLSLLLQEVKEFSFEMQFARSLAEGLAKIGQSQFDAILTDLGLPDSVGIATYDKIRKQAMNLPIIVISGNDDRSLLTEVLDRGADNYLIKESFDGNRIAIAILSAMRNKVV